MAKAKVTADELGGLSEALRAEYGDVGGDGLHTLTVEAVGGFALEDASGLRTALERERANVKGWKTRLGGLPDDFTADSFATMSTELEGLRSAGGKPNEAAERRHAAEIQQIVDKHAGELSGKNDRIGVVTRALASATIDEAATRILTSPDSKTKGVPALLLPHIRRHTKLVEEGEVFRVSIIDPSSGVERITQVSGEQGPMKLPELIGILKTDPELAPAFPGSGASGTGAEGGGGPPEVSLNGAKVEYMTEAEAEDHREWSRRDDAARAAGRTLEIRD